MKLRKYLNDFSDRITKEEFDNWYRVTMTIFAKIWLLVLFVELLLFAFYKPNPQCGRWLYFQYFIIKPSGIMLVAWIVVKIYSKVKKQNFYRWQTSLSTIIMISTFCAAAVWSHTSVKLLSMVLMFPLVLTTLYRSKLFTWLQIIICIFIYVMYELYFLPHSPYLPPLNSFIGISIFVGSIFTEYFLLQQVKIYVDQIERKANKDSMTGLYNHKAFYEELERECKKSTKKADELALLVMDIDKFKNVNDTYGHAFGDEVICKVAEILKNGQYSGFCSRYGGEEFAMLLPNTTKMDAVVIAEEIRKEFEVYEFVTEEGEKRHFSVSIGVAVYDPQYKDAREFFVKADENLYFAKQNGRNQVCAK